MEAWLASLGPWTVAVLSVVCAAEYLFPVIPGRVVLIAACMSVGRGDCGAVTAFAALTGASMLSAFVQYQVGRRLHAHVHAVPEGRTLGLRHAHLLEAGERLRLRGRRWLVLGEFIPFVRSVRFGAAALAGMGRGESLALGMSPVVLRNAGFLYLAASAVGDSARAEQLTGYAQGFIVVLTVLALGTLLWPWLSAWGRSLARSASAG